MTPARHAPREDAETGERRLVDTSNRGVRRRFEESARRRRTAFESLARSLGVDLVTVDTSASYMEPLMRYFRLRARRY